MCVMMQSVCSVSMAISGRVVKVTAWRSYPVCGLMVLDVLNFTFPITTEGVCVRARTHTHMYAYNKISSMCD